MKILYGKFWAVPMGPMVPSSSGSADAKADKGNGTFRFATSCREAMSKKLFCPWEPFPTGYFYKYRNFRPEIPVRG